jgi:hypothetical protein
MERKNRGWTLVVIGACACFVAALGAANPPIVFGGFAAAGTSGPTENPRVNGVCKIKYNSRLAVSHLDLKIHGLLANTLYGVKMDGDGAGFSAPQAFTTDCHGRGNFDFDAPGQAAANTFVQVYIWDGTQGYPVDTGDDIFTVTDGELRANAITDDCEDDD